MALLKAYDPQLAEQLEKNKVRGAAVQPSYTIVDWMNKWLSQLI